LHRLWQDEQRRRWLRPNTHLWIRPDAKLWLQPNQRLWQGAGYVERKAGFNPDQPRDWHGQWTDDGGDAKPSDGLVRLAGDIPTGDSPELPKEKPATSEERTSALKLAARFLAQAADSTSKVLDTAAFIAKLGPWYLSRALEIQSYNDPPSALEDLQRAVSNPKPGYDTHHIVERSQAADEGYPDEVINGADNLVLIPRLKHQEINAWYQTKNPNFNGVSPRAYLSGRNWAVKRAVGLEALEEVGVLKP
jgi:hypothetical protein